MLAFFFEGILCSRCKDFLFIHHQSGGHIFDVGGSNMPGPGYCYVFRER
jgi:hypothetical protein